MVNDAEDGTWPEALWNTIEETGLTQISVSEERGGGGGNIGDAMAVLKLAGRYSVPLPLAETMLAGVALSGAGQDVPAGPLGFVLPGEGESMTLSADNTLSGTVDQVGWAIRKSSRNIHSA